MLKDELNYLAVRLEEITKRSEAEGSENKKTTTADDKDSRTVEGEREVSLENELKAALVQLTRARRSHSHSEWYYIYI